MPRLRHVWPFAIVAAALCVVAAHGQNLDEGKTGPQLFALDCQTCHRSPQGLAKNHSGWSLTSFLRQHYTSSSGSASVLAAYLTAAGNARPDQKKGRADERQAKQSPPSSPGDQAKAGKGEPTAQPGQPPTRKQREQVARPADPTGDQPARPSRRTRRGGEVAEPVPGSSAEPTSSLPAAAPDAARGSLPAGAAEAPGSAQAAAAPQPGFGDPLP